MWPFNRKKKKQTETETVEVPEKTYAQWKQEYNALEIENAEQEDKCAKDGDSWQEMLLKTKPVKEKMAYADKMMRKIQEPSLTFNKKWKGKRFELSDFVSAAAAQEVVDADGEGYYATETAKTDILIRPSDITKNIYRTDFPYVLWFPKEQN